MLLFIFPPLAQREQTRHSRAPPTAPQTGAKLCGLAESPSLSAISHLPPPCCSAPIQPPQHCADPVTPCNTWPARAPLAPPSGLTVKANIRKCIAAHVWEKPGRICCIDQIGTLTDPTDLCDAATLVLLRWAHAPGQDFRHVAWSLPPLFWEKKQWIRP